VTGNSVIQPRSILLIVAAIALMGSPPPSRLEAQELPRSLASLRYVPAHDSSAHRMIPMEVGDSTTLPRTYWLEGALIVGIPFALLGVAFAGWGCSNSDSGGCDGPCWDNELLGAVVGFGTGASLGGLIGGQFKKKDRRKANQVTQAAGRDSSGSVP
jgi:hypothetical protein